MSGGTDTFFAATTQPIGEFDRVTVQFAGGDSWGGNTWKLGSVRITELLTGRVWVFLCRDAIKRPGATLKGAKQSAKGASSKGGLGGGAPSMLAGKVAAEAPEEGGGEGEGERGGGEEAGEGTEEG
jgi:hypothetical protein